MIDFDWDRKVKVTKIQALTDSSRYSYELGYWITGVVAAPPEPDKCLYVIRDSRNGVEVGGHFRTSTVMSITYSPHSDKVSIETLNSTYVIEPAK